ncbi:MAG: hypothetical protein NVSMB23_19810 [Myxococcales bacterium]
MSRTSSATSILLSFTVAAVIGWLVLGRYLWTGSNLSQIVTPSLLALWTYFVGNAGVDLIRRSPGFATPPSVVLRLVLLCGALVGMMKLNC